MHSDAGGVLEISRWWSKARTTGTPINKGFRPEEGGGTGETMEIFRSPAGAVRFLVVGNRWLYHRLISNVPPGLRWLQGTENYLWQPHHWLWAKHPTAKMSNYVINRGDFVINRTCFVVNRADFVKNRGKFVTNRRGFVLRRSGFVINRGDFVIGRNEFVIGRNEFVIRRSGFVSRRNGFAPNRGGRLANHRGFSESCCERLANRGDFVINLRGRVAIRFTDPSETSP
jgi:hypothetical protein